MTMKKEADGMHPASHYLVVGDPELPSTWHLLVMTAAGKPDHRNMGAAHAALMSPQGFRGQPYEGPDKEKAIAKLKALYAAEKMQWPEAAQGSVLRAEFPCRLLAAADAEGKAWDVEIARVGVAESRRFEFTRDVLARDAGMFENVRCYRDHQPFADLMAGKTRSIEDLIGYHSNARMGEGALVSTLHLLEPEKWALQVPRYRPSATRNRRHECGHQLRAGAP